MEALTPDESCKRFLGSKILAQLMLRPGVGFVAVGASAAVLLVSAPSLLSATDYRATGVVWITSTLFGIGIASPMEQLIARRIGAGEGGVKGPTSTLGTIGLLATLGVVLWTPQGVNAGEGAARLCFSLVCIWGWCLLVPGRSRLAGARQFTRYTLVLLCEALGRVLLVGVAAWDTARADLWLGLAVGAPLLLAAALAGGLVTAVPMSHPTDQRGEALSRVFAHFVGVTVGFQTCMSGPTLVADHLAGKVATDVVSSLVAASTYFRAATVLFGGMFLTGLVDLTVLWRDGDPSAFAGRSRQLLKRGGLVALGVTSLQLLLAPVVLPLYFGSALNVNWWILIGLAVSTFLGIVAALLVQPLLAASRGVLAAVAWISAGGLTTTLVAIAPAVVDPAWSKVFSVALVAGPLLATVVAAPVVRRMTTAHQVVFLSLR